MNTHDAVTGQRDLGEHLSLVIVENATAQRRVDLFRQCQRNPIAKAQRNMRR